MAHSHPPKLTSRLLLLLFFIIINLFSTQIQARTSQIFGEFKKNSEKQNSNNTISPENVPQNTTGKEEEEKDPVFVRETGNGYGLYGHELDDDQLPPNTNGGDRQNTTTYNQYNTDTRLTRSQFNYGKNYDSSSRSSNNKNMKINDDEDEEKRDDDRFYYRSDAYGHREKNVYNSGSYTENGAAENVGKYFSGGRYGRDVNADSYGSGVEGYYWNRPKNVGEEFEP